jgi:hypothetical protein
MRLIGLVLVVSFRRADPSEGADVRAAADQKVIDLDLKRVTWQRY